MQSSGGRKTLIFNGSPRKQGDTAALVRVLTDALTGEFRVVDCYREDISPCIDCRHCRQEKKCVLEDAMQEVYRYLEDCDNVVIASPIYYAELTGKLLDAASRFQVYYSARFFRGEDPGLKPKRGGVILVGGGDGDPARPCATGKILLRQLNVREIHPLVCSHRTNTLPAAEDREAVSGVLGLAAFLNGG
ncbi:MAG: flavodoxin family protein [Bacteroidales bacterium]|nr:flavodoxin family protein [Bacteroidales bacterium]